MLAAMVRKAAMVMEAVMFGRRRCLEDGRGKR